MQTEVGWLYLWVIDDFFTLLVHCYGFLRIVELNLGSEHYPLVTWKA